MVYDAFLFFYELDLLEIRLNILSQYVDYFVIVESNVSFIGEPKKLYFQENKERFKKWDKQIIHYVIDRDGKKDNDIIEMGKISPTTAGGIAPWLETFYQMESTKKALVGANDDDVCYISDVDEIWKPNLKFDLNKCSVYSPLQDGYLYYLNYRNDGSFTMWNGTTITNYKTIKNNCLNHIKNRKMTEHIDIINGGWHFEAFGGEKGAREKIEIVKFPDYYTPSNLNGIDERLNKNQDYKGRNLKMWIDNENLPEYIKNNIENYKEFLLG